MMHGQKNIKFIQSLGLVLRPLFSHLSTVLRVQQVSWVASF